MSVNIVGGKAEKGGGRKNARENVVQTFEFNVPK